VNQVFDLLARHGYWVLFVNVFLEQLGIPVPAVPVLFGMGALAGMHRFAFWPGVLLAVAACLLSDSLWSTLGRRKGQSVLKLLCRISLEPESCVSLTKGWFERLGPAALLFAKFVPGFSTAAQPMAGVTGISVPKFIALDGLGSFLWATSFLGLGYLFHDQVNKIWEALTRLGAWFGVLVATTLAVYLIVKYWQRTIYIRALRGNRIEPSDLQEMLASEEPPVVLDLRRIAEVQAIGFRVPGARWIDVQKLDGMGDIVSRRGIILYCS
jgi:membrane protein DedA with SNARE-associated domain